MSLFRYVALSTCRSFEWLLVGLSIERSPVQVPIRTKMWLERAGPRALLANSAALSALTDLTLSMGRLHNGRGRGLAIRFRRCLETDVGDTHCAGLAKL